MTERIKTHNYITPANEVDYDLSHYLRKNIFQTSEEIKQP